MLPDSLLLHRREGNAVHPRWLEAGDLPWLEEMLVRRDRAIGQPQRELEEILLGDAPFPKRRLVARVLSGLARPMQKSPLDPKRVRAAVFGAAAGAVPREQAMAVAADLVKGTRAEVESSLFADLPGERRVAALAKPLSPEELRLKVNFSLAAAFLARAVRVTVKTEKDPLPLVRHARWNGLIAERREGAIVLSGPFSLFRHSILYGSALAGVLPALARLGAFSASVDLLLRGTAGRLTFDAAAPVFLDGAVKISSSSPAARLARELLQVAPGWAAIADPEPLAVGGGILDADLLLVPPDGGPAWRVELLRFWTAAHVRQRVDAWTHAGVNVRLLLDAARNGGEEPPPEHPAVIVFDKRPNAVTLLARLANGTVAEASP